MMEWIYDDGGRALAGYKGDAGDCVTRAITIACRADYESVYQMINETARRERPRNGRKRSSARTGVKNTTHRSIIQSMGGVWHPTMGIGTGCTVHLRDGELPAGRLIVALTKHLCAVIDGVIHDTHDPSRDGTRCVYGYYVIPS